MDQTNQSPDLQSILNTLARFAPQSTGTTPSRQPWQNQHGLGALPQIDPPTALPSAPQFSIDRVESAHVRPQTRPAASPQPVIDPATITTWKDGLKCVTKIAAQNAQFAASIRKMMQDQRDHELRWYRERQALKQAQASRAIAAAKVHSALSALNGSSQDTSASQTRPDPEAELADFHRTTYAAQQELEGVLTSELKALGVPFFGTDSSVLVEDGSRVEPSTRSERPKWSPIVSESELLSLRRRMVAHLEDLYRD